MDKTETDIIEGFGYRTLSKLGLGGYGSVFLVEKNGKESVLKIAKGKYSKEINLSEIREAIILKQFNSPYIISIGDVNVNVKDPYIAIELEKMDSAFSKIEKTKQTVNFYRDMIYNVVQALFYMHTRGFVHNDIKPQNILLKGNTGNTVKLADFGLCNYLGIPIPNELTMYCSTDYYKAPDSVGDKIYIDKNRYNYNSDIYSVGTLMYWIVIGAPFKKRQTQAINLLTEEYIMNQGLFIEYFGEEGVHFMERCLEQNTDKRMNSKQALEDPYLKKKTAGGSVSKFVREKYPEVDIYVSDYVNHFYKNYKDVILQFSKIRNSDEYIKLVEEVLEFSLKYNRSLESFIQYILLFRKAIRDFPQKKLDDLSLCCFSITNKLYENTACNVMIKRLLRDIKHKTAEETLIKLELEILNHYGFNVPIVPIYSMLYYYSLLNKKIDINRSYQSAIRLLLSTEIQGESTLDELVQFIIKPIKSSKLERLKEDGKRKNLKALNAIEIESEIEEDLEEEEELELEEDDGLEVEICEIDGKKYLKDESGTIYDAQTQEIVGKYDFQKKKWIGLDSPNVQSTQSTGSNLEVEECVIDGITYLKDEEGNVYDPETEETVGKFNFSKKVWINYKESLNSIYENAMRLYTQGDRVNMVRYLEHHIDLFSGKKYLNLRRVILEKAQEI